MCQLHYADPQLTHGFRHIEYWCSSAARVQEKYKRLTGGVPRDFVNSIMQNLIAGKDLDTISLANTVNIVASLLKQIQCAENHLLKHHGLCNEYQQVLAVTKQVRELCMWLEDIQCHVMLDMSELHGAFIEEKLMYQRI